MITPALVSGLTGVVGPKTGLTSRQTSSWTEVASGGYCSSCSSFTQWINLEFGAFLNDSGFFLQGTQA